MKAGLSLPSVTVDRPPPENLHPGDEGLFRHEYQRSWGPCSVVEGSWATHPDGVLLKAGRATLEPRWFQAGIPQGRAGWVVRAKSWLATASYRRRPGPESPLVITDEFSNGYFHWVADALPKLAWLSDELEGHTLVLPWFATKFRYMEESLAAWPGLKTLVLEPGTLTKLDLATLVPAMAPTGNYRPEWIQALGKRWRSLVGSPTPSRKVYISRARAPWRKVANEAEILPLLHNAGYEVIQLETLSFAEQVRLMAETKIVLSNHGAGLTNALFMPPGGAVVEFRREGDAQNNCYYSLAAASGHRYYYQVARGVDRRDAHQGDVHVDPVALATLLRDLT